MNTLFLSEHRCECGKLLLKGIFFDGALEIKCKKCGTMNKIGAIKLADDATHYLLIIDDQCKITNVSNSACRILGYTHEELIGKNIILINPTMPKEICKKFFVSESLLDENNHFQLDTTHQSKDGKTIPVFVFFKLYKPTGKESYVLMSVEVRDGVNAKNFFDKDALNFLDNACDFYFDIDKNGVGEYASSSVEKIFGFSPEVILGENYFDYLPIKTRAENKKIFVHFSTLKQPFKIVQDIELDIKGNPLKNKGGKVIHNELYFTTRFSDSGVFIGYRVLGWVIKSP